MSMTLLNLTPPPPPHPAFSQAYCQELVCFKFGHPGSFDFIPFQLKVACHEERLRQLSVVVFGLFVTFAVDWVFNVRPVGLSPVTDWSDPRLLEMEETCVCRRGGGGGVKIG